MKTLATQDSRGMNLRELSDILEVSVETIRNWQRLGVLPEEISCAKISDIKSQLVTSGRLTSRANKLYGGVGSEENRYGVYYTPVDVINNMLKTIPQESLDNALFLDPCCGSGNFLEGALAVGFRVENIYGYDCDEQAVAIAQRRMPGANIVCADFLEIAHKLQLRFDYIYTNPPWGKRLDGQSRSIYTARYSTPRSADTTGLFLIASLGVLRQGGRLGFLVQEAMFNIGAFEWLRERLLKLRIVALKDYGKVFKSLMTRAQSIILDNRASLVGDMCRCDWGTQSYMRELSSFARLPKKIINFWATNDDMAIIDRIYALPHTTLNGAARWALGIVTGDNRRHCSSCKSEEFSIGVVMGSDISTNGISAASIFINRDLTRYQQSAPREVYEAPEKLIYRFISSSLCFAVDKEQRYTLNSANCLVIVEPVGASVEQISELLNSRVMNWIHHKIFRSHKILRGDIETLPLHVDYFQCHEEFRDDRFYEYLGMR